MDAIAFLLQADTHLCRALSEGSEGINDFNRRMAHVRECVEKNGVQGFDTAQTLRTVQHVRASAALFLNVEEVYQQTSHWIVSQVRLTLREERTAILATNAEIDITPSDSLNSKVLRQWFADNIVNPFLDTKTKNAVVAKTNALPGGGRGGRAQKPIDGRQVMLWFINMRRRSGWTSFRKVYARKDTARLDRLVSALRRQGEAPPAGVTDGLASLMCAWNVPMVVERAKKSNQSVAIPLSTVNPATADPTGTIRAKACRNAYSKMMDFISAGAKERVGDWLDEILEGVEEKPKIVAQTGPVTSLNIKSERKIAVLPGRASKRQNYLMDHSANSSSASIVELPSSGSIVLSPRKAARLPGSELGPRLPSTVASESTLVPTNFWQASLASNPSLSSFITPSSNTSLPTASMNFTLSMPLHGFENGVPAQPRNSSSDSSFSGITDITQSSQSTDSSATTQSSQASYAYFASGMGMGDSSLVRSNCPSEASPLVGQSSSPAAARHGEVRARDDNSVESAPKRFRAGNRPRHTDGGAPMSMANLSMMPVDQAPFAAPTMNLNLSLSMNPQPGMGPFGAPQQQFHPGMSTPVMQMPTVPAAAAADLAAWYYQTLAQQHQQHQNEMPVTALHNSTMPPGSAGGMRSFSDPQRFTDAHGPSVSSFNGLYMR
ncbi:unnamed protein product [Tilletia controversa]|nr:unnamed protein product [Tilletia controversa]